MQADDQRILLSAVIFSGHIEFIGHCDLELLIIEGFLPEKVPEGFSGIPVDMDLVAVRPVLCAARVNGDRRIQVTGEAGLPLVKADDISAVILIIRDLRSGNIIAHFRIEGLKTETAGVTVGADADVEFRGELQLQKGSEAVRGDGHIISFDSRVEPDLTVIVSVNEEL